MRTLLEYPLVHVANIIITIINTRSSNVNIRVTKKKKKKQF